jgi:hypothetical protein
MNEYNALRQALKPHLGWHGARIGFSLYLIKKMKNAKIKIKVRIRGLL